MTPLTTMSAAMNMLHGDRSRGRWAASIEWGVDGAGAAMDGESIGVSIGVMTAGSAGASVAGAAAAGAAEGVPAAGAGGAGTAEGVSTTGAGADCGGAAL